MTSLKRNKIFPMNAQGIYYEHTFNEKISILRNSFQFIIRTKNGFIYIVWLVNTMNNKLTVQTSQ